MFGIGRYRQRGGGTGNEQQVIEQAWIGESKSIEFVGNAKDDMKVAGRWQFPLACGKPALACLGLTLGAMPVSTRVVRDGLMSAFGTSIEMTAEHRGAATLHGAKDFELLKAQARLVLV